MLVLRFVGNIMMWVDLRCWVVVLVGVLSGCGVGFGDWVMILMFNCIEFVELVLVVNMIGVIVVLLNFWFILIEIVVLVEDCVVYVMLIEVVLVLVVIGVCNI